MVVESWYIEYNDLTGCKIFKKCNFGKKKIKNIIIALLRMNLASDHWYKDNFFKSNSIKKYCLGILRKDL